MSTLPLPPPPPFPFEPMHTPPLHHPAPQSWPHAPQLRGSPAVSTHAPLQSAGAEGGHDATHENLPRLSL